MGWRNAGPLVSEGKEGEIKQKRKTGESKRKARMGRETGLGLYFCPWSNINHTGIIDFPKFFQIPTKQIK